MQNMSTGSCNDGPTWAWAEAAAVGCTGTWNSTQVGGGGGALGLIQGLKGHPCCERRVSLCTPEVQEDHRLRAMPNHKAGYIPNRCKHSQKPPYTSGSRSRCPLFRSFRDTLLPSDQLPRHLLRGPTEQASLLGGLKLLGQGIWRFLVGKCWKARRCLSPSSQYCYGEVVSCWTFLLAIQRMQRCDSRCKTANIARRGIIAM